MRQISYLQAIKEAMAEELRRDPDVFLIGEDIGKHGGAFAVTKGLFEEFGPQRIKDTPISEGAIVGCSIGAAIKGLRPIVEIMFIDFSTLAMDQIFNQAAKMRYMLGGAVQVPMVIRFPQGSGFKGTAAQHSQCLEALYAHIPGLKVVLPATPYDAKGLLKAAIRDNNPVIYIEQKTLYGFSGPVPEEDYTIPLGKAEVKREGRDVSIITYSYGVKLSLEAAENLIHQGIDVEVVDVRTIKPLDKEILLTSVKKTGRVVIVHEACKTGGFGAEIAAIIAEEAFDYLDAPVKRVACADVPISFNYNEEGMAIISTPKIETAITEILG